MRLREGTPYIRDEAYMQAWDTCNLWKTTYNYRVFGEPLSSWRSIQSDKCAHTWVRFLLSVLPARFLKCTNKMNKIFLSLNDAMLHQRRSKQEQSFNAQSFFFFKFLADFDRASWCRAFFRCQRDFQDSSLRLTDFVDAQVFNAFGQTGRENAAILGRESVPWTLKKKGKGWKGSLKCYSLGHRFFFFQNQRVVT